MSELESLNPGVENVIHTGDKLMISQQVNYVRIKVTKTEVSNEDIAYTTQKVDNANMYKGTTKTSQSGSNGVDKVTRLVTYIDGVQVSSQEVSRETLVEPVNEIIQVGTKSATYSSSGSVGSYTVVAKGSMVWPLTGCYVVSSGYGYRSGGFHGGIDISNGRCYGNIVVAAASGTVTAAGWDSSGYGNKVMINHGNGVVTLYGHMSAVLCSVGQYVNAGDAIGRCGASGNATGPHLHFEVRINGSKVNPAPYIGA
jgi:murein DD-endopeptidase MepM/ murein hydrolase activator NlpD